MSAARAAVLAVTTVFALLLGYLTVDDLVRNGPSVLTLLSFGVVALLAAGAVGALTAPPDE